MHELRLCSSIIDVVERRAPDRPVALVRVRIGLLRHVRPEAFDSSFAVAALGTVAEDAAVELLLLPITARCDSCTSEFEADEIPLTCPVCDGSDVELTGGDELMVESIEYR